MTGKTHRVGGMLCCIAGYSMMQDKGMLLGNVSPVLQMSIMYPFAIYGSMVSDMDHNWDSAPCKDVFSWFIWRILHASTWIRKKFGKTKFYKKHKMLFGLLDSRHRSWQTHSDLFLALMLIGSILCLKIPVASANAVILVLIFEGLLLGVFSHLFLDLITPEGIYSFVLTIISKVFGAKKGLKHIHLVPNKGFFATDSDESPWERNIRKLMWILCFVLIFRLLYLASPYRFEFQPSL